jgi:hypothetical protein
MKPIMTLAARLENEAKSRPSGTPTAEQAFDALAAGGLAVEDRKQVLGATVKASFCMMGRTKNGMSVSVCEYPDEKAADAGRAYSLETFQGAAPHRAIVVNKKTTLTLSTDGPLESDVDAKKAQEIFAKL